MMASYRAARWDWRRATWFDLRRCDAPQFSRAETRCADGLRPIVWLSIVLLVEIASGTASTKLRCSNFNLGMHIR